MIELKSYTLKQNSTFTLPHTRPTHMTTDATMLQHWAGRAVKRTPSMH